MTSDQTHEVSKGERAVMKQRLHRIAQLLDEVDAEERALGQRRSKLMEEQAKLNAKVYRA